MFITSKTNTKVINYYFAPLIKVVDFLNLWFIILISISIIITHYSLVSFLSLVSLKQFNVVLLAFESLQQEFHSALFVSEALLNITKSLIILNLFNILNLYFLTLVIVCVWNIAW